MARRRSEMLEEIFRSCKCKSWKIRAELAPIRRDIAAAKAVQEVLRKTKERALQEEAGLEQQVSSLATVMGVPSSQSIESDLDRMPPFTAQHVPGFPLSNSRFIPGPAVEESFDPNG
eukprot:1077041-Pyramimonas_sp.AAC.1